MVEYWLLTTKIYTFFDLAFYALFILFPLLASSILLSLLFVEGTLLLFLQSLLMLVLLFHHGFVGFLLTPILLFIFTACKLTIFSPLLFLAMSSLFFE